MNTYVTDLMGKITARSSPWQTCGKIILFITLYLIFFWVTPLPFVVLPILFGLSISFFSSEKIEAVFIGASTGALAPLGAFLLITPEKYRDAIEAPFLPATKDVLSTHYQGIATFVFNESYYHVSISALLIAIIFSAATMGCLSYFLVHLYKNRPMNVTMMGATLALILVTIVIFSTLSISNNFSSFAETIRLDKFGYDGHQYARIYDQLRRGSPYYKATFDVKGRDSLRGGREIKSVLRAGGSNYRSPYIFYFWKYFAPTPSSIGYWAIGLSGCVLLLIFYAAYRLYPMLGILVGLIITPYLIMMSSWENVLFPTFWATLLLVCATAFVLLDKPYVAAVFLLSAGAIREIALVFIVALLLGTILTRKKRWLVPLLATVLGVFLAFWIHNNSVVTVMGGNPVRQLGFTSGLRINNLLAASAYQMFPYTRFTPYSVIFVLLGFLGGFTIPNKILRFAFPAYFAIWTALNLFAYSSSYWGQLYMLPALLVTSFLLVRLLMPKKDRLGAPIAMRSG